jgi:hypothetical protein
MTDRGVPVWRIWMPGRQPEEFTPSVWVRSLPSGMASMLESDILDRCGVSHGGTTNSTISSRVPLPSVVAILARTCRACWLGQLASGVVLGVGHECQPPGFRSRRPDRLGARLLSTRSYSAIRTANRCRGFWARRAVVTCLQVGCARAPGLLGQRAGAGCVLAATAGRSRVAVTPGQRGRRRGPIAGTPNAGLRAWWRAAGRDAQRAGGLPAIRAPGSWPVTTGATALHQALLLDRILPGRGFVPDATAAAALRAGRRGRPNEGLLYEFYVVLRLTWWWAVPEAGAARVFAE